MAVEVEVADRVRVVQGEEDPAPDLAEPGPAPIADRRGQALGVAPDVVGGQQVVGLEGRADDRLDRLDRRRVDRDRVRQARDGAVLQLQEDEDRHVPGVRRRPVADLPEGVGQGRGGAQKVDVLDVEDLRSRLIEDAAGVRVRSRVLPLRLQGLPGHRLGIATALGVGEDVELDLPDAEVAELLGERPMGVVEPFGGLGPDRGDQAEDPRARGQVIRVMGADHLELVEPQLVVERPVVAGRPEGRDGQQQEGRRGRHRATPWSVRVGSRAPTSIATRPGGRPVRLGPPSENPRFLPSANELRRSRWVRSAGHAPRRWLRFLAMARGPLGSFCAAIGMVVAGSIPLRRPSVRRAGAVRCASVRRFDRRLSRVLETSYDDHVGFGPGDRGRVRFAL